MSDFLLQEYIERPRGMRSFARSLCVMEVTRLGACKLRVPGAEVDGVVFHEKVYLGGRRQRARLWDIATDRVTDLYNLGAVDAGFFRFGI